MENSITNITNALIKAQGEMSNAKKGSDNPYFKSRYADLNAIREAIIPVLNKYGIAVLQPIVQKDGAEYVRTLLLHESGEVLESDIKIVVAKERDAQAQGSGITYARRYGLQSFVCLGAEDDDGNKASEQPIQQAKQDEPLGSELAEWLLESKSKAELAERYKKLTKAQQQDRNVINALNELKERFKDQ